MEMAGTLMGAAVHGLIVSRAHASHECEDIALPDPVAITPEAVSASRPARTPSAESPLSSRATSSRGLSSAHRASHSFPYPLVGAHDPLSTARPASPPRCLLNTQRASGPSGLEAADRGGGAVAGGGQQGLVSLQSSGYSPSSELAHRAQRRAPATQCEEKGNLQPHLLPPPSKHVPLQQLRPAPIQPSSSSSISPKAHDFTTPQKPRSYLLFLPYSQPSRPNIYYQILSMF